MLFTFEEFIKEANKLGYILEGRNYLYNPKYQRPSDGYSVTGDGTLKKIWEEDKFAYKWLGDMYINNLIEEKIIFNAPVRYNSR